MNKGQGADYSITWLSGIYLPSVCQSHCQALTCPMESGPPQEWGPGEPCGKSGMGVRGRGRERERETEILRDIEIDWFM